MMPISVRHMPTIRLTNVWHLVLVFALVLGLGAGPTRSEPPTTKRSVDAFGDPLPAGALHRLGTTRFRHGGRIGAIAFLPGNKALFSGACDETIRIWDVASGRECRSFGSICGRPAQSMRSILPGSSPILAAVASASASGPTTNYNG